jgi:hypothetical protein
VRRVLSFWVTPLRPQTWRWFGYAIVALPATVVCMVMAVAGRADTAAGYEHRLATGLSGRPVGAPRHRVGALSVLAVSVAGLAIGAVTCRRARSPTSSGTARCPATPEAPSPMPHP